MIQFCGTVLRTPTLFSKARKLKNALTRLLCQEDGIISISVL